MERENVTQQTSEVKTYKWGSWTITVDMAHGIARCTRFDGKNYYVKRENPVISTVPNYVLNNLKAIGFFDTIIASETMGKTQVPTIMDYGDARKRSVQAEIIQQQQQQAGDWKSFRNVMYDVPLSNVNIDGLTVHVGIANYQNRQVIYLAKIDEKTNFSKQFFYLTTEQWQTVTQTLKQVIKRYKLLTNEKRIKKLLKTLKTLKELGIDINQLLQQVQA
jgi:hypothetical protein